ncbi:MAG: hypothetical protein FJ265_21715, partial [Planctomycetes bacterium]|nr:hypothetical protein [Planctomycetota bacterium]
MPEKRSAKNSSSKPQMPPDRKKAGAPGRLDQLQRLIDLMVDKDVVEVEIEEAGARWRVRRREPQAMAFAAPAGMALPAAPVTAF